jgi:FO synthase subunit 2
LESDNHALLDAEAAHREHPRTFSIPRRVVRNSLVPGVRKNVTREDVLRMYAVSRLMLDPWIVNIQATWVKQGARLAQDCLSAGANDFGGTLMNESISTSAGAPHGQFLHPAEMRFWIRGAGRIPAQRSTAYETLHVFEQEPVEAENTWSEERFGSYPKLIASTDFRFQNRANFPILGSTKS